MGTIEYDEAVRPGKLHEELRAAIPELVEMEGSIPRALYQLSLQGDGSGITLTFPDSVDPALVQAVLDAHDASTPSAGEAAEDQRRQKLRAFLRQTDAEWASRTPTQQLNALREFALAVGRHLWREESS